MGPRMPSSAPQAAALALAEAPARGALVGLPDRLAPGLLLVGPPCTKWPVAAPSGATGHKGGESPPRRQAQRTLETADAETGAPAELGHALDVFNESLKQGSCSDLIIPVKWLLRQAGLRLLVGRA